MPHIFSTRDPYAWTPFLESASKPLVNKCRLYAKRTFSVNEELISFYWSLGRDIAMMKPEEKWGQGFYDTLSRDLRQSLPDAKGFSYRNLHYMRQFYELFPFLENMQQAVAQIGQNSCVFENVWDILEIFGNFWKWLEIVGKFPIYRQNKEEDKICSNYPSESKTMLTS
jgi:predicted nuclease of restriction endonuclease-like (RecB) superfamily